LMAKVKKQYKQDITRPNYKPVPSQKRNRYGRIPGIEPGSVFSNRKACADAGVHCVILQGIHGSPTRGAYSVCLSGVYEDDKDDGEFFIYTGTGGKEDAFSSSSEHVLDQSFKNPYNRSLKISAESKQPVRVVRGANKYSKWAPTTGYRYDGLYLVIQPYFGRNKSGHLVCKFKFQRLPGQPPIPEKPTASKTSELETE